MNVDMDPGSTWNVNTLSNENECQQYCETATECKVMY